MLRISSWGLGNGGWEGRIGNIYPAAERVQIVYFGGTVSILSVFLLFWGCFTDLLFTGVQHLLINLDFVSLSKQNFPSNTSMT